jgi:MoxR-like ATPase
VKNREPAVEPLPIEREFERFRAVYESLRASVSRVIVGHEDVIEQVLLSLVAGGHALLEGVPGIGKTLLVRTLASSLDLSFARIQFTPDLMPADIAGTNIVSRGRGRRAGASREFGSRRGRSSRRSSSPTRSTARRPRRSRRCSRRCRSGR